MFEVLAFVYDNYWHGDACPALPTLQRRLNQVGFDDDEVMTALVWLEELKRVSQSLSENLWQVNCMSEPTLLSPTASAMRVFTPAEQTRLDAEGWAYLLFLVSAQALPQARFELVMDRIMAAPGDVLTLEDLKLIVLMVFWSLGEEPDALVLDDLCDTRTDRIGH